MRDKLQELHNYRELLYMIACRDIKVRYKQSIMGFAWAILMPTLIVLSGVVVRYAYSLAAHTHLGKTDLASVAVKSLPWAFLVSSIRFSCNSLTNNKDLVSKIYFPKEIFPLASVIASLFDFLIASGAIVIVLMLMRTGYSPYLAWLPVLFFTMVLLATGFGLFLSAASLFFRDVKYIVEVALTFGIFFTPVFYDVRMFGNKGEWLLLNPIAPLLEGFSSSIAFGQSPDVHWLGYSLVFGLVGLLAGYSFFKYLEPFFAESI
jgi:lipopolysaccharide transport system permease protein